MERIETPEEFVSRVNLHDRGWHGMSYQDEVAAVTARDAAIRASIAEDNDKIAEKAEAHFDGIVKPLKDWIECLPNGNDKIIAQGKLQWAQLGFDCWYTARALLREEPPAICRKEVER